MKKFMALFIVVMVALSCVGCKRTEETTSVVTYTDETVEVENKNGSKDSGSSESKVNSTVGSKNHSIKDPMNVNLKGETINIYTFPIFADSLFNPNKSASKQAKAQAEMIENLQKKLNCKINVKTATKENIQTQVSASAAAGKALCDILCVPAYNCSYYVANKLVASLSSIDTIDLSFDYMDRYKAASYSALGGKSYATATGDFGITYGVFYNKRIMTEIGKDKDYPYSLVKSGEWNISKYSELAKAATNSAKSQWGQVCIDPENLASKGAMVSIGTSMLNLKNGKLEYNMDNPKVLEAINASYDYIIKQGTIYREATSDADKVEFFANGKSLFFMSYVSNAAELAGMDDDYGFVPLPKMNSASNYNSAMAYNTSVFMILNGLSAERKKIAGAFVQAYNYSFDNVINVAKSEYTNRYLCDSQSADNLILTNKGQTLCPEDFYGQIGSIQQGTFYPVWNYFNKNEAPAKAIASSKSTAVTGIKELNEKYSK